MDENDILGDSNLLDIPEDTQPDNLYDNADNADSLNVEPHDESCTPLREDNSLESEAHDVPFAGHDSSDISSSTPEENHMQEVFPGHHEPENIEPNKHDNSVSFGCVGLCGLTCGRTGCGGYVSMSSPATIDYSAGKAHND